MKKAALRWIGRLLVLGACAALLAVVVHTPWARGLVLHQLTSRLSARTGLVISADAIDYDLFALTATVDGLRISRPGSASAPVLRVRQARIALTPRILSGAIEAASVEADGVALVIDLARATRTAASRPFSVPAFTVGRVALRHVDVDFIDADGIGHLKARDIALELDGGAPRRLEGTVVVAGGLTLDNDDTHARIDRVEARASLDGDTIGVQPSLAVAGAHRLAMDGSVTITGPSPRFDLGLSAEVDVAQLASWFPALPSGGGSVRLEGRVTGPLDNPRLAYSARTAGVTMPELRLPATTAEGSISRAGIYLDRMRTGIGRGWIEAAGRLALGKDDPASRFSLRWADVEMARLSDVFPLLPADPIGMVSTGSARVRWPGMALEFSTVAGEASADVRFAPHLAPARVGMEGSAGRWTLGAEQELDGGTRARLDATIAVRPGEIARSPILGALHVSSSDLHLAASDARRAFAGLPDIPEWLEPSPLAIDGTIDGTLGDPRFGGKAVSSALQFAGVPPLDASATFAADATGLTVSTVTAGDGAGNRLDGSATIALDARRTKGTIAASVRNPESWLDAVLGRAGSTASADALKIGGALEVRGTWDGPLDDPIVSMTARAMDVTVTSPAVNAERVTAEGRLEGPMSGLEGALRINAGTVRAEGMRPSLADAQLSLKAGRIEAAARIPEWSASLRGHLSTAKPHDFAATFSIEDFTAPRLLALVGGQQDAGWTADGTVSATFDAAGRLDDQSLLVRAHATLTGGALRTGDRRVLEGVDAVMELGDGRMWLTRLSGVGLGGPVSASADVPLSWLEAYLPAGWRVGESAASRRPASFDMRAEPDVKTLGEWLRPDEPGAITGALRLRLSGTASAASVDALDARAVLEPTTVTVRDVAFTLPRAAALSIANGRASVESLTVTAADTTASLSGSIGLIGDRPLDARVTASGTLGFLSSVVPGRPAGAFNATFRATGPVADPELSGSLSLDNAGWAWPEQRVALRDWTGKVVATAHTLAIEKLAGQVNGGEANVAGAVTFSGGPGAGLTLTSGRLDIAARAPDWSAKLDGHIAAEAPHDFSATLSVVDVDAMRLEALTGAWNPEYVPAGTITATIDATGSLGTRALRVGGRATLAGGGLSIGRSRVIDGVDAAVETRDGRLWLTRFTGRVFGGPLSASGDLPLSWIEEYVPAGWRVDEGAPSRRPASFELGAEPDLVTLGTWLRPDEPRRMTGALRFRVAGTAAAPSVEAIDARFVVEPGSVTIRDVPFTLARAAEVTIGKGQATIEHFAVTAPGAAASATGTIGLTGELPLNTTVSVSGAMGFLTSILPGRLAGRLEAALTATGTVAAPKLNGRVSLENALWVWPAQRIAFRDWTGEAVATSDSVTIERLAGHVNGGDADIAGTVTFGDTSSAGLTVRLRDAFVEVVRGFRSQADADLKLSSTGDGARISGTITVTSGAYREPVTAMARLLSTPRRPPATRARTTTALGAVELDVNLIASSPIVIENSAARLDLMPSMRFQGSLEEPVLRGTLDMVDEGRLSLLGRSFRLNEGRVTFPGSGDPSLRLIGETRVGDYAVTLRLQGPVGSAEATYTSDPPLSQRDVQSLLVTGRTTDSGDTRSGDAEEFVLGASSDLLGLAGQMVGLDSVQLGRGDFELGSSDVNPAMRLTVTKRITARSSLILSQDLDNNKLTWIVVLVPRRGYEIRLSQRDNLEEVVEFRQELSFGPGVSPPSTSGLRRRVRGPRVRALEFIGDLGHPTSALESVVRLKPPREFDASTWQADRARLEAFYRDHGRALARIVPERTVVNDDSGGHVLLRYRVDPGPRTVLNVSGISLSDDERRSLMLLWSNSFLTEFFYDDVPRHLRGLLSDRGYLRPSISVTLDEPDPSVVVANVAVAPGEATLTRRLVIEGARAVPEPELRTALADTPALADVWLDPAPLMTAITLVYAERGYPSAHVSADELVFDGTAAERRLRVIEGPRAVVADIVMTGVADARAADAKSAIALQPGQPVLPGVEADATRRLRRFYLDRGFRSATVRSASKSDPDGRVALTFLVTEGPQSIVHAVAVEGLEATRPSVADGAITLTPGEPAGQQAVAETQRRLYGLGVFRSADISVEPTPGVPPAADGATVPVTTTVSLEEARRFRLRYGIQASNQYGPILEDFTSAIGVAGDARDRNFLGRAFTLGASFRFEKNLQSLRGQFSLPPLLNQRLQTNYYATIRSETDTSDQSVTYTDKERDLTFEQRLRLPRLMEVSWGYSYNVRDVLLRDQGRTAVLELKGALASLNGTFLVDRRDKPFDASHGWFQSSNLQWGLQAVGSDYDYLRLLLRQFYYQPAGPFILASGVRLGWLHGFGGTPPVTILDRFFDAGGSQTVRGYAEDSLSAVEIIGQPVGGTKLLILNQEVRFPLFSRWFQGAVFIDAGNTFAPSQSIAIDKLAVGTGFGVRIMTPFAPIRIDVGYPLNRRPEDRPYRVYFSIGQIF